MQEQNSSPMEWFKVINVGDEKVLVTTDIEKLPNGNLIYILSVDCQIGHTRRNICSTYDSEHELNTNFRAVGAKQAESFVGFVKDSIKN
jgi:hypothetical protein